MPVGQLTAPEVTKLGVEMFAVCAKHASKADNAAGKRQAREALFNEKVRAAVRSNICKSCAAPR